MKTQIINSQSFGNNKFRVPVTLVTRTVEDVHYCFPIRKGGYVKEYLNPNAKDIYKKLQETKDIYERAKLDEQLGDYEIKPMNTKEKIHMFFKNIF